MKILSILFILVVSTQARAFQTVLASGSATDCCFRTTGDLELIVAAAKEVEKNLRLECGYLNGNRGTLKHASQKVLSMESTFSPQGSIITIDASAKCFKINN